MNARFVFAITTFVMMALPTISHANSTAPSVMINAFCQNIDGDDIALSTSSNETCQAYFYQSGWLSNYRIRALNDVLMSEDFNDTVLMLKLSEKSVGQLTFINAQSLHRFSSDIASQSAIILNHQTKQAVKTQTLINPKHENTIKSLIKDRFKTIITKHQQDKGTIHWIGLPRTQQELSNWLSDTHIDKIYQAGFLNDDLTLNYCANGSGGGDDRTFQECISIPAKEYLIDGLI